MASGKIILASASKRRKELFSCLKLPFSVFPSRIDEARESRRQDPVRLVKRLALAKAQAVSRAKPDAIVVGADTLVVFQGRIFGKPGNKKEAERFLKLLCGKKHRVLTGLAVISPDGKFHLTHVATSVWMRRYSDQEIKRYVASGQAQGKAGAYAIQDEVFKPVRRWKGCFCNVVGLPLWKTAALLRQSGVFFKKVGSSFPLACEKCLLRGARILRKRGRAGRKPKTAVLVE